MSGRGKHPTNGQVGAAVKRDRRPQVGNDPVQRKPATVFPIPTLAPLAGNGVHAMRQAQLLQMQRQHGNAFVLRQIQGSAPSLKRNRRNAAFAPPRPGLAAVQSLGKLVIGYTDTLPGLQRENQADDSAGPGKDGAAVLKNGRFSSIQALQSIAGGAGELTKKHNGLAVQAVQQALFDLGYPLPRFRVDGKLGSETYEAIRRFREDQTLAPGTALDGPAMEALDRAAPAPGKTAKKSIDYDKLLADGKLTFTVAIGYDDNDWHVGATQKMLDFFAELGFSGAVGKDGLGLFSKEATFLVSDPDTGGYKGKVVNVQIRFITPDTQNAKAQFAKGLSSDDISLYSGHARYGTGPDFDKSKSAAENFTIGVGSALHKQGKLKRPPGMDAKWYHGHRKIEKVLGKRANDLEQMEKAGKLDPNKYQVWFLNACSTLHYLDELRNPGLAGSKNRKNLDIIGTRKSIYLDAEIDANKAFITGVLNSETLDQLMANMQGAVDRWVDERTAEGSKMLSQANMFFREGFGDNPTS